MDTVAFIRKKFQLEVNKANAEISLLQNDIEEMIASIQEKGLAIAAIHARMETLAAETDKRIAAINQVAEQAASDAQG